MLLSRICKKNYFLFPCYIAKQTISLWQYLDKTDIHLLLMTSSSNWKLIFQNKTAYTQPPAAIIPKLQLVTTTGRHEVGVCLANYINHMICYLAWSGQHGVMAHSHTRCARMGCVNASIKKHRVTSTVHPIPSQLLLLATTISRQSLPIPSIPTCVSMLNKASGLTRLWVQLPFHCYVATMGKLFTHVTLSSSSIICYQL